MVHIYVKLFSNQVANVRLVTPCNTDTIPKPAKHPPYDEVTGYSPRFPSGQSQYVRSIHNLCWLHVFVGERYRGLFTDEFQKPWIVHLWKQRRPLGHTGPAVTLTISLPWSTVSGTSRLLLIGRRVYTLCSSSSVHGLDFSRHHRFVSGLDLKAIKFVRSSFFTLFQSNSHDAFSWRAWKGYFDGFLCIVIFSLISSPVW